jgi:hypothetical protein
VKSHLCSKPEDYQWSSHQLYFGHNGNPGWITTPRTRECFADLSDYTCFVLQGLQQDHENPFDSAIGGLVFGSKRFAKQVGVLVWMPQLREDVPGARRLTPEASPSAHIISAAVDEIFLGLSECQRRRMVTFTMRRFTDQSGREIAGITRQCPSTVTHVWREIQMRLGNDGELRHRIEALALALKQSPPAHPQR